MEKRTNIQKPQKYRVKGKIWRWPGDMGWHFLYISKGLSEKLYQGKVGKKYGSGFIKIRAKIGKTSWDTALFPHAKEGLYLIAIKAKIRKSEGLLVDDLVSVSFEIL
jgi:hypothetical protein